MADLVLTAKGSGFQDQQYDLRAVEKILSNYRMILDNSVSLVAGQRTMTDKLRSQIEYKSTFRAGSLEVLTNLVLPTSVLIGGLASDGGYQLAGQVSKLLNGVMEFRRIWTDFAEKGKKPEVTVVPDSDVSQVTVELNNVTGNGHITISPIIIVGARQTKGALDRLISSVDGNVLESLKIQSDETTLLLTSEDERVTGSQKEELPSFIELIGRLDVIQFNSHKGQIVTSEGRFPVSWDDDLRDKVRQYADQKNVVFRAKPIVDHRRFGDETVGFHLLNIWHPQERTLL